MKFKPHDYQRYCIERVISDDKLGLFLDMGLGKTVITLTAVNDLRFNRFLVRKVLVIAPKKVAEDTWTREQQKWEHLSMLRVIPVLGSLKKRISALNTIGDVYVINRENVQWLVEYYRNCWPFDMVVIDELSSFKNPKAKRFKALRLVRRNIKKIIGLTGTPAPNGLIDLWSQVYLLDEGERLGKTLSAYREVYFTPGKRNASTIFSYDLKEGSDESIRGRIKDICISLSAKDYLTLPDRIDNTIYVNLPNRIMKQYEEFERNMLLQIDEDTLDAATAAVLSNKLLQFCNGAVYAENGEYIETHSEKLEALKEIVEAAQGKSLLIFYNFVHDRDRIKKALSKCGVRIGELKSAEDITAWNNRELDVLLAQPQSAAYGLNLQAGGNVIVWFGLNWSLEYYQQANARLYRQGQTEKVIIHHLVVKGCKDEDVMDVLQGKGEVQSVLLESLKAKIKKYKESFNT